MSDPDLAALARELLDAMAVYSTPGFVRIGGVQDGAIRRTAQALAAAVGWEPPQ